MMSCRDKLNRKGMITKMNIYSVGERRYVKSWLNVRNLAHVMS